MSALRAIGHHCTADGLAVDAVAGQLRVLARSALRGPQSRERNKKKGPTR